MKFRSSSRGVGAAPPRSSPRDVLSGNRRVVERLDSAIKKNALPFVLVFPCVVSFGRFSVACFVLSRARARARVRVRVCFVLCFVLCL